MSEVTNAPQSVATYLADLHAGQRTVEQLTKSYLSRIVAQNPQLNAFLCVTDQYAKRAASAIDVLRTHHPSGVGPLCGATVSIKDLIDTSFAPTTYGSKRYQGHEPSTNAMIVSRIEQAHGVIVGKTNLHEFAYGITNENDHYGNARNPADTTRMTGGSSGGSAASIRADLALLSVGTDTGGSVRIPASLCGVVGYKPTYGLVPVEGVHPLAPTLDHVGTLTKCVRDAALLTDVMTGFQTRLRSSIVENVQRGTIRAAIPRELVEKMASDGVGNWFEGVVEELERSLELANVGEVSLDAEEVARHQQNIISAEAYATHATSLLTHSSDYGQGVYNRLMASQQISASDYIHSLSARIKLQAEVERWFDNFDVILLPTTPVVAQPFGTAMIRTGNAEQPLTQLMTRFTNPWNLTGYPAISLPVGTIEGLPIGLQIVGQFRADAKLLRIAERIEHHFHRDGEEA